MINKIICFVSKHKVQETKCPYTMKTYQLCDRCGAKGVKE